MKNRCKSPKTFDSYKRYNINFQEWVNKTHGKRVPVTQKHIEDFLGLMNDQGKSTREIVAALKFRFRVIENKQQFNWEMLAKKSQHPNEHQPWPKKMLLELFERAKDPALRIMLTLLYELGARKQDLLQLRYDMFKPGETSCSVRWPSVKSRITRETFITNETKKLIDEYKESQRATNHSHLFSMSADCMRAKLFRGLRKLHPEIQPHDLRHSRAQHLHDSGEVSEFDLQQFFGHKKLETTAIYVKSDICQKESLLISTLQSEPAAAPAAPPKNLAKNIARNPEKKPAAVRKLPAAVLKFPAARKPPVVRKPAPVRKREQKVEENDGVRLKKHMVKCQEISRAEVNAGKQLTIE